MSPERGDGGLGNTRLPLARSGPFIFIFSCDAPLNWPVAIRIIELPHTDYLKTRISDDPKLDTIPNTSK